MKNDKRNLEKELSNMFFIYSSETSQSTEDLTSTLLLSFAALENPTGGEGDAKIEQIMDDGKLSVNEDTLLGILEQEWKKPIGIIAIAGVKRAGKSFILNFLQSHMEEEWNFAPKGTLSAVFESKCGRAKETCGITMLNRSYHNVQKNNLAVMLMDSQGIFDSTARMEENHFIFSLTAHISSVLIYNIVRDINTNDLDNLKIFVNRTLTESETADEPDLQTLVLLIRDFRYPNFEYGLEGGAKYLQEFVDELPNKNEWVEIEKCFQKIHCYLMPSPGDVIVDMDEDIEFADAIKVARPDFTEHGKIFAKKVCEEFCEAKTTPHGVLCGEGTFELAQVFEMKSSETKVVFPYKAFNYYDAQRKIEPIEQEFIERLGKMDDENLTARFESAKAWALRTFQQQFRNFRDKETVKEFQKKLNSFIEEWHIFYRDMPKEIKKLEKELKTTISNADIRETVQINVAKTVTDMVANSSSSSSVDIRIKIFIKKNEVVVIILIVVVAIALALADYFGWPFMICALKTGSEAAISASGHIMQTLKSYIPAMITTIKWLRRISFLIPDGFLTGNFLRVQKYCKTNERVLTEILEELKVDGAPTESDIKKIKNTRRSDDTV